MTITSLPYIVLLGFLFGSTLIASRFSVGQFHPTSYVSLRLVLASLGYVLLFALRKNSGWPRDWRIWGHASLVGVMGTAVPMTLIVSSMQYQSSGLTAVLLTVGPAITVVMAHFALPDEGLSLRKIFGVTLAFAGAVLLAILGENGLPDMEAGSPAGYWMVLTAMFFGSASAVYIRRFLRRSDTLQVASVRMVASAAALVPATLLLVGFDLSRVDQRGLFALGYASLAGTFAGMLLAVYIAQRFGATPAAMTSYVVPVVAAIGGVLVLDELITPGMLAGMGLIAIGITVLNRRRRKRASPPEPH